jgi:hypothetical protein
MNLEAAMSINVKDDWSPSRQRDRVIRRRLSLWETDPPKNEILMSLYRYWESLRPTGLIPARKEFDIVRLKPVMGLASVVEVNDKAPMDFRFRLHGTDVHLPKDLSNRTLAEMSYSQVYREMLAQDYEAAREIGVPLYHEVAALIDYVTHSYARLILPFATDHRNVDQLIVCSVLQEFPDLIQRLV